jgi:hypothetical protein
MQFKYDINEEENDISPKTQSFLNINHLVSNYKIFFSSTYSRILNFLFKKGGQNKKSKYGVDKNLRKFDKKSYRVNKKDYKARTS